MNKSKEARSESKEVGSLPGLLFFPRNARRTFSIMNNFKKLSLVVLSMVIFYRHGVPGLT